MLTIDEIMDMGEENDEDEETIAMLHTLEWKGELRGKLNEILWAVDDCLYHISDLKQQQEKIHIALTELLYEQKKRKLAMNFNRNTTVH